MLDSVYRPLGLGAMLVVQDVSILLSCVALVALGAGAAAGAPVASSPLFGLMVVLAMAEKLASISSELAIERDWYAGRARGMPRPASHHLPAPGMHHVRGRSRPPACLPAFLARPPPPGPARLCRVTQLAGKQNVLTLARSNAYLRRTDLCTELVGALVFGWIYSWGGLAASMAFTGVVAAAAVPLQLLFIRRIAELAPSAMLHGRQEPGAGWARVPNWRSFVENARLRCVGASCPGPLYWLVSGLPLSFLPLKPQRHAPYNADPWCPLLRSHCMLQEGARGGGCGQAAAAAGSGEGAGGACAGRVEELLPAAHPAQLPHLCAALLQRRAVAGRPHHGLPHAVGL